jgi:RHH-type proline utilization regulon transcriptional repressor/proline dehydrogenase/delta 1-pyrroline-5-carboxylate dehydrogenase
LFAQVILRERCACSARDSDPPPFSARPARVQWWTPRKRPVELSLAIFASVFADARLGDYSSRHRSAGLSENAWHVLRWPSAREHGRGGESRVIPGLVKGAYWDTEIKRSQEQGLDGYRCSRAKATPTLPIPRARKLLLEHDHLKPQFATHNAHTVVWISSWPRGAN